MPAMCNLELEKLLNRLRLIASKKYLMDNMLEYNEIWKFLKEQG